MLCLSPTLLFPDSGAGSPPGQPPRVHFQTPPHCTQWAYCPGHPPGSPAALPVSEGAEGRPQEHSEAWRSTRGLGPWDWKTSLAPSAGALGETKETSPLGSSWATPGSKTELLSPPNHFSCCAPHPPAAQAQALEPSWTPFHTHIQTISKSCWFEAFPDINHFSLFPAKLPPWLSPHLPSSGGLHPPASGFPVLLVPL